MIYIISRRILNLEDIEILTREEVEEAVKADTLKSKMLLIYLSSNIDEFIVFIVD